jgi:cell shape-determining protein MreC
MARLLAPLDSPNRSYNKNKTYKNKLSLLLYEKKRIKHNKSEHKKYKSLLLLLLSLKNKKNLSPLTFYFGGEVVVTLFSLQTWTPLISPF